MRDIITQEMIDAARADWKAQKVLNDELLKVYNQTLEKRDRLEQEFLARELAISEGEELVKEKHQQANLRMTQVNSREAELDKAKEGIEQYWVAIKKCQTDGEKLFAKTRKMLDTEREVLITQKEWAKEFGKEIDRRDVECGKREKSLTEKEATIDKQLRRIDDELTDVTTSQSGTTCLETNRLR